MIKKILFILFLSITTLGFSQEKTIEDLSAAPNPFTNYTNIIFTSTTNSEINFTVKNVLGKTVFKQKVKTKSGKNSIPFYKNNLPTGMYIYSIQNNKKIISKRFVIR
ncbi:T9SS type A sorting domain-containing protein [uncultured Polaribacter sp.]|uniref:T9SS type A sorting domain-containing protein n=1 Tax=uncultured Polaribacter sp. TaxID=174711 RepID=UPI002610E0CF|nr:T9SS type A sorting domain-containing protein [uncultured Polaribacter sp.]